MAEATGGVAMFDPIGAFARQFVPLDDGYLYYPSRKSGGKFVTAGEFDELVADWERIAGRRGQWKTVGLVFLAILLWTLISQALSLPEWADQILIFGIVIAMSGWLLWASFAPRRLVRHREAIVPPRPPSQARREARALLSWPLVIFATLLSGGVFLGNLNAQERTPSGWAWLIGSGLMFGLYVWIGFQKLRDKQR